MNNPLILVIDDSLTARMKLKELLETDGARVMLAETASQATELAVEHRPDVVILDVVLPDGNGIEICKRWRDNPALKDTLVLLISGERSGHDDRAAGLRAGALGYVLKPFSDPELLAQVGMLVRLNGTLCEMREAKEAADAANRAKDESLARLSRELAERKRAEQAFLREKQKLDDVTGSATCGLLLLDEQTRIVYANRTVQDWFGSLGQITGRECCEVFGVKRNEEECPGLKALRVRRTVHGRVFTRAIGGEERSLYAIASPLKDAHGRIRQIAEAVVDITEQRLAEEELERAYADLKQKNAEMEQFVYTVSHDLKSPLVTLRGFSSHLQKDAKEGRTDRLDDFTGRIQRAAERLTQLIDDLLDLSSVGRFVDNRKPVRLTDLIQRIMRRLEGQLAQRNVEISIQVGMPTVEGDEERLSQIFDNLLTNAIQYGCSAGEPRIDIGAEVLGERVRVFIRDNGRGIRPEYHDKIFGLFQRLDADKKGTGVGLAIVRRIVEVHGGRIWVESDLGAGATFWVEFPASCGTSEAKGAPVLEKL